LRLSKEEKIAILRKRIENFKTAITDPNNLEYAIYSSKSPKKDRIRAWAETLEQLHELGDYQGDICTISTHISSELKTMGLDDIRPYARQVLPFKYKDANKMHSERLLSEQLAEIREDKLRKKLINDEAIARENKPYIDQLTADAGMLMSIAKKLETTEFVSKIDPYLLDEHLTQKKGLRKLLQQEWDRRDKVLPEKQHLLLQAYTEATKSFTFTEYLKQLNKLIEITGKQTVRILTGRVTKVEMLYEPKNRMEARHLNFYGTQCQECGSWRVDVKYDSDATRDRLFCYACKKWDELKTKKLISKMV
jgi:hypothetical protein